MCNKAAKVLMGLKEHTTARAKVIAVEEEAGGRFDWQGCPTQQLTLHPLPPRVTPAVVKLQASHPEFVGHPVMVSAFRAVADGREFYVGFGVWSDAGPTLVCGAVLERLQAEIPDDKQLTIRLIAEAQTAYHRTVRTLRAFRGTLLLCAYRNEQVLDAAMPQIWDTMVRGE